VSVDCGMSFLCLMRFFKDYGCRGTASNEFAGRRFLCGKSDSRDIAIRGEEVSKLRFLCGEGKTRDM